MRFKYNGLDYKLYDVTGDSEDIYITGVVILENRVFFCEVSYEIREQAINYKTFSTELSVIKKINREAIICEVLNTTTDNSQ